MMRLSRNLIGKMVEVSWADPSARTMDVANLEQLPRGRKVLGCVHDRGILDDITEGVARVVHSLTDRKRDDITDDHYRVWASYIQEEVILEIKVYEEVTSPAAVADGR